GAAAPEAQKLRFGQWLLNAINSGNYRGLRWIDPARTTFRVPWKHNARKDITSSDLEVFKGWAKASGRYEEGFEDPAKWKTNFRCALSSTHLFNLEEDNSKRGDDPHKVFSVVSGEPRPMEDLTQTPAKTTASLPRHFRNACPRWSSPPWPPTTRQALCHQRRQVGAVGQDPALAGNAVMGWEEARVLPWAPHAKAAPIPSHCIQKGDADVAHLPLQGPCHRRAT
uniref:Interferon regulatory factor 7 n=1 Tax=Malurus cyaneus samueli TaxID=2593467 RepID=A0A8C5TIL8_9PASS